MAKFYKGKNSQKLSFDENPECSFFIAQDFNYTVENIKKKSKKYACFNTIKEFFDYESTLTEDKKSCYETLKNDRVEIYDIDGDYTFPVFQSSSGLPASDEEIINEFIDARMDFQEENYPDIPIARYNHFLIKKTDDPNNKKISFHILVRNGFKFKDEKHLKSHTQKFLNYCKDLYKVKIDMSIYSSNRLIRCLGHHKLDEEKRFSYRYKGHSLINETCKRELFYSSYLEGHEQYYPEKVIVPEGKEVEVDSNEDFVSNINILDSTYTDDTVSNLVKLICETIDLQISPICDEEFKNKLSYDKWWRLVVTVFNNLTGEFHPEFLYNKLFPYYRHCNDIDKDQYFKDLYAKKGVYKDLTINSLHYLARFNKKYKDNFAKEIEEFREKKMLTRHKRLIKKALKAEENNIYPINYINQITSLHGITNKQPMTLKHIENTINKIICNITNGGDNSIFCLDKYYCNNSNTYLETYKQIKYEKLVCNSGALQIYIKYINLDFEPQYEIYKMELEDFKKSKKTKKSVEPVPPPMFMDSILGQENYFTGVVINMLKTDRLTHYSRPVFIPHLYSTDKHLENYKDCLNLFLGFPFKPNNVSTDLYKNSMLRENLRKHLCNGDIEPANFEFVEKHTAHMLQKPYERADMAIIMTGSQGTGKDLWCNHLSKLIGLEYFFDVASISLLFKDFNASQGRKLLVKMNEISDKGDNFDKHNQLKEKITATRIRIEPKGFDSYFIENFSRYYGFSQYDNVVVVENTDRRFFMIKTNNDKANNQEYFSKIIAECDSTEMLQSSFNYYATLDITGFNPRIFPNTDYREDQKIQSLPNDIKFFYYLFENNQEEIYTKSVSDVFCQYCSWCIENNIKMSNTKLNFSKDIKKLGITIIPRMQVGTKRVAGISITHKELENIFQKYLGNKNFLLPKYE